LPPGCHAREFRRLPRHGAGRRPRRHRRRRGRRLTMPVLALWGSAGLPSRLPTLEIWRAYADDVTGAEIPECGHFIPEEQPEALLGHLRSFLADEASR
ncbi:alpha/beta fold hydrolase, partial [Streptomyces afghaniensis]|uniref:alpha/beta fold hydrolase n=1 Tax=Streptomyces afghaniensis TaxID=66865 RepID=UPI0024696A33